MSAFGIAVAITMYEELFDLCHIQHTRQIGPEKRVMPGSAVRARHIPGVRSGNRKRPLRLSASPLTLVAIYLSDWFSGNRRCHTHVCHSAARFGLRERFASKLLLRGLQGVW